jgi:hypothetical protein
LVKKGEVKPLRWHPSKNHPRNRGEYYNATEKDERFLLAENASDDNHHNETGKSLTKVNLPNDPDLIIIIKFLKI